jgi:hypothetical protein
LQQWLCESIREIVRDAARYGHVEVIESARRRGYTPDSYLHLQACKFAQLGVLEWADVNMIDRVFSLLHTWSATGAGHVNVLEWMLEHGITQRRWMNVGR